MARRRVRKGGRGRQALKNFGSGLKRGVRLELLAKQLGVRPALLYRWRQSTPRLKTMKVARDEPKVLSVEDKAKPAEILRLQSGGFVVTLERVES